MNKILTVLFLAFAPIRVVSAQEGDSTSYRTIIDSDTVYASVEGDTIPVLEAAVRLDADSVAFVEGEYSRSPTKALMFALVLPGLGQTYNKKYWKIPIVWAALGVAGYAISFNTGQYQTASELFAEEQSTYHEQLLNYWRRNMELSYISMVAVYALQMIDAYVDAHLFNWDVNENLSIRWSPSLQPLMTPVGNGGNLYGFSASIKLKR